MADALTRPTLTADDLALATFCEQGLMSILLAEQLGRHAHHSSGVAAALLAYGAGPVPSAPPRQRLFTGYMPEAQRRKLAHFDYLHGFRKPPRRPTVADRTAAEVAKWGTGR
jgi:hypothetical protein